MDNTKVHDDMDSSMCSAGSTAEAAWQITAQRNPFLQRSYQYAMGAPGRLQVSFDTWLNTTADGQLTLARKAASKQDVASTPIDWEAAIANLPQSYIKVVTAIQCSELSGLDSARQSQVYSILSQCFPANTPCRYDVYSRQVAENAFRREEAPAASHSLASKYLLTKIDKYSDQFYAPPNGLMAPYTSLVGPSGMGKSFAVQQLAKVHGRYVLYTCFAPQKTAPVPGPTPGIQLSRIHDINASEYFWGRYLRVGLLVVEAAVQLGLSADSLFQLQTDRRYKRLQEDLSAMYLAHTDRDAEKVKCILNQHAENLLATQTKMPPSSADATSALASRMRVVFCLDEARTLLKDPPGVPNEGNDSAPILFRGFRHVLRDMALADNKHKLFALLLDTSSQVSNFVPAAVDDPSRKVADGRELFAPIYTLPTWDATARKLDQVQTWLAQAVCRDDHGELLLRGPDDSDLFRAFLYSLGRPLWGGIIAAELEQSNDLGKAAKTSLSLAASKTRGDLNKERALALLSYRLQFYIYDQVLARTLTAQWMRFPIYVSADRRYIQTAQPSEPVLAAVAKITMQDPDTLAQIIDHFVAYYHGGAVNSGDAGEIVASILLLLAADSVKTGPAVPLRTFIAALLGGQELAGDDLQGQVYLTHICRFHSKHTITHSHLIHAFLSGQGWLLSTNAEGADLLIPVWNPATGRVGGMLVQVKNRSRFARITPGLRREAKSQLESAYTENSNSFENAPLCGLFMELRGKGSAADAATEWLVETRFPIIVAFGFAGSVYPVLAGAHKIHSSLHGMLNRTIAGGDEEDSGLVELLTTRDGTSLFAS